MKLTADRYEQARAYLRAEGRPLERALAEHWFDGGSAEDVVKALAGFANPDGGFGHGLEPDVQTPASSVIATTVAFQTLAEVGAAGEALAQPAIGYLMASYDAAHQRWPIAPEAVEDAPHAPWWTFAGLEEGFAGFWANPRAEVVGYLYRYGGGEARTLAAELTPLVLTELGERTPTLEMHDLLCCLRLSEAAGLPATTRAELIELLRPAVDAGVAREPGAWAEYGLQPLAVVERPSSPFGALLGPAVQQNLDWAIEQQGTDGAWAPAWNWGDAFPIAWPAAERAWKGVLTLGMLRRLQAWGRLPVASSTSGMASGEI